MSWDIWICWRAPPPTHSREALISPPRGDTTMGGMSRRTRRQDAPLPRMRTLSPAAAKAMLTRPLFSRTKPLRSLFPSERGAAIVGKCSAKSRKRLTPLKKRQNSAKSFGRLRPRHITMSPKMRPPRTSSHDKSRRRAASTRKEMTDATRRRIRQVLRVCFSPSDAALCGYQRETCDQRRR
ncbi:unnamed protein product [Amoebophrya sp. A25]|nr:unnamed protein product [Amoebophrya sp. A25]|eukprot:GSA25T00011802001.1